MIYFQKKLFFLLFFSYCSISCMDQQAQDISDIQAVLLRRIMHLEELAKTEGGFAGTFCNAFVSNFGVVCATTVAQFVIVNGLQLSKSCIVSAWRKIRNQNQKPIEDLRAKIIEKEMRNALEMYEQKPFADDLLYLEKMSAFIQNCPEGHQKQEAEKLYQQTISQSLNNYKLHLQKKHGQFKNIAQYEVLKKMGIQIDQEKSDEEVVARAA